MRNEAVEWCKGKNWQVRSLFLIWFAYVLVRHWGNPDYRSILGALNLGLHELGHFVFSFLGEFVEILGGTLLQVLAPLFGVINFYRQGEFFGMALSFGWLSTSFFEAATYVADARAMDLPLVSPFGGDNTIHDWNYILTRLDMLQYDAGFAFLFRCAATVAMFICLVSGLWLLLQMKKSSADIQENL